MMAFDLHEANLKRQNNSLAKYNKIHSVLCFQKEKV